MVKNKCTKCGGTGKCGSCLGTLEDSFELPNEGVRNCSICFGSGNCSTCSGRGRIGDFEFEVRGENADEVERVAKTIIEEGLKEITTHSGKNIQLKDSITGGEMHSILFLAADPTDASRLRLGQELREIQEKLKLAKLRDLIVLNQRMSVRPADLSQVLLDLNPEVVHFSGHGMVTGELCFEDEAGKTHPIQPDAIADLFEQFTNQIRCVILNACYSEYQAKAIVEHIDYVVGMKKEIGDKAAIAFAIGFYQALGAGRSVEDAFKLGCVQIKLQGVSESLTPILVMKDNASVFQVSFPDTSELNEESMLGSLKIVDTQREIIKVDVIITRTGERLTVKLPLDRLVRYIKNELIEILNLPHKFEYGGLIDYQLHSKTQSKFLDDGLTLRQNDINDGDTLLFHIVTIAG